jgi:hypothetical protein
MENDTGTGGEPLSIDEAVKVLINAEALEKEHAEAGGEATNGDNPRETVEDAPLDHDPERPAEGEPDEEESEEDEGGDADDELADDAKVQLDDGSVITIAELKKGHLRQADYTKKTQALAAERRTVEKAAAVSKERGGQVDQHAEYLSNVLLALLPPAPDRALGDPRSPHYDPAKFQALQAQHRQWSGHLNQIAQQRQRSEQQRQAETGTERSTRLEGEMGRLTEKLPHLKDEKRLRAFVEDTQKYGAQYGFSPEEIAGAGIDHRQLVVLEKAIRWDRLEAQKARVATRIEGRPPVKTSGKRLSSEARRAREASGAMERLKSTGRLDDAVRALIATTPKG